MECFRPIIIVFVFLLFPPWGWPRGWPKHVSDSCVIKLHSYIQVHLLLFLKKMYITIILLHAKSRHWFWTPLWWGKLSRPSPSLSTLPWRYIRSGSVAPRIFNLCITWRRLVRFISRPHHRHGKTRCFQASSLSLDNSPLASSCPVSPSIRAPV